MKICVRFAASLLVLVLWTAAQGAAQQPPAAQPSPEELAALEQIFRSSDPAQRLPLVEEFLAKYPQSPLLSRVYSAAAESHRMRNDYAKAIEYGERAIELSPRDIFALILVADSLAEGAGPAQADFRERLTKGEDYARRALEILPELFAAMDAQRRPEVPEEQYKLQKQYIEAQPHATLGFIYLRRNQNEQAVEELEQTVELNQMRPNPVDFQRLGIAYLRQREYGEAETAFQHCVELGGPAAENCQKHQERLQRLRKAQETLKPEKPQE